MRVEGSLGFAADASLRDADVSLHSRDIAPLRPRYLSGWLGLFGLSELQLQGALSAHLVLQDGEMTAAEAQLDEISLVDAQQRFRFEGLSGKPVYSATAPISSEPVSYTHLDVYKRQPTHWSGPRSASSPTGHRPRVIACWASPRSRKGRSHWSTRRACTSRKANSPHRR